MQVAGQLLDTEFQPTVTATCKGGYMTIRVNLNQSFVGAVHARDHRTPQCMVSGNGTTHATLGINLFASQDSPEYCGVLVNNVRLLWLWKSLYAKGGRIMGHEEQHWLLLKIPEKSAVWIEREVTRNQLVTWVSCCVNRYSAARGAFAFRGDAFGLKLIFAFIYNRDKFQKINCFEKVGYMLIYLAGRFKRLENNIKIDHTCICRWRFAFESFALRRDVCSANVTTLCSRRPLSV